MSHSVLLRSACVALLLALSLPALAICRHPIHADYAPTLEGREHYWDKNGSMPTTYGDRRAEGDRAQFPDCGIASEKQQIRIPVLIADWESTASPPALPQNIEQLAARFSQALNGERGLAHWYREISGGQLNLAFDVIVIHDSQSDYLRPLATYQRDNGRWDHPAFTADMQRAFIEMRPDLSRYDSNGNQTIDAMMITQEPGAEGARAGKTTGQPRAVAELVKAGDPAYEAFQIPWSISRVASAKLDASLLSGDAYNHGYFWQWAHELGHILLGYADYYPQGNAAPDYNFGSQLWSLSSSGDRAHAAAWEKWLFAHWIKPTDIVQSGVYTVAANEKPDGQPYDEQNLLFRIPLDGLGRRFLTVENRWFAEDGNTQSFAPWSSYSTKGSIHKQQRESGIQITEMDFNHEHLPATAPQVYRHVPTRPGVNKVTAAFKAGDTLHTCLYQGSKCVDITVLDNPGAKVRFQVDLLSKGNRRPEIQLLQPALKHFIGMEGEVLTLPVELGDPDEVISDQQVELVNVPGWLILDRSRRVLEGIVPQGGAVKKITGLKIRITDSLGLSTETTPVDIAILPRQMPTMQLFNGSAGPELAFTGDSTYGTLMLKLRKENELTPLTQRVRAGNLSRSMKISNTLPLSRLSCGTRYIAQLEGQTTNVFKGGGNYAYRHTSAPLSFTTEKCAR